MGRTPCCNVEGLKKGAWTSEEDRKLTAYIQEHGEGGWRTLPQKAGLQRCGKSCRLRWANYLRPDIKRGEFSPEEEERIIELHASLGNRWSAIARHLPRRTDNEIKNYWNTHLKKRLSERGIDPTTHKPIGPTTSSSDDAVPSLSSSNNNNAPTAERQQQQQLVPGPAADDRHASSSASAQLLNKLAAKLAPHSSSRRFNTEQDEDVEDGEAPNDAAPKRSSSSSAKLLNKMASRLAHPLHCLNTLKSILSSASSSAAVAAAASGTDSAGNYSNFMHRCASTSSLSESTAATTSISTSNNDHPAQTASSKHDQLAFLESLDLDVLNDWQQHDPQVDSSDPAIMEFLADTITSKEKEKPYHYNYDQDSLFPASQYGDDGRTLYGSHTLDPGTYADDHYQYMDFDGPSTSASRNYNDPVDDSGYAAEDHAFTATGDTYGHHQFEYQHGAGRLLDGDDEYGRTLFDNYGDFRIDAPAFF